LTFISFVIGLIVIIKLTKSRGINSIKNLQPKNSSRTQIFAGLR